MNSKPRILIVDDDENTRKSWSPYSKKRGMRQRLPIRGKKP